MPSYYTVEVKNLPLTYSEETLKGHFCKFGAEVAQVSTVYNYQSVLNEIKNLLALIDEYATANKEDKINIYEEIGKQLTQVRILTKFKTPLPVMCFLTFEDVVMRKKIKDLYKYKICPRELMYEGKMLKLSSCNV